MLDFSYWIFTFMFSILWSGVELYFIFLHEDLDEGFREPFEVSEALFKYAPIEMVLQVVTATLSLLFFKPWPLVYNLIMMLYNYKIWRRGLYAQHFITRKEYSKRDVVERIIKYKLIYYMVSVFFTLLMTVIWFADLVVRFYKGKRKTRLSDATAFPEPY